jgi:hypothetical protein
VTAGDAAADADGGANADAAAADADGGAAANAAADADVDGELVGAELVVPSRALTLGGRVTPVLTCACPSSCPGRADTTQRGNTAAFAYFIVSWLCVTICDRWTRIMSQFRAAGSASNRTNQCPSPGAVFTTLPHMGVAP